MYSTFVLHSPSLWNLDRLTSFNDFSQLGFLFCSNLFNASLPGGCRVAVSCAGPRTVDREAVDGGRVVAGQRGVSDATVAWKWFKLRLAIGPISYSYATFINWGSLLGLGKPHPQIPMHPKAWVMIQDGTQIALPRAVFKQELDLQLSVRYSRAFDETSLIQSSKKALKIRVNYLKPKS